MENPEKFPLLRLPTVVLQEVFQLMMPSELLRFSKSSSKSKQIMKTFTKMKVNRNRFKLKLVLGEDVFISFHGNAFFKCRQEYLYDGDKPITTYICKDLNDAFRTSEYVMDLFNCELTSLVFNTDMFLHKCVELISWLRPKSLESLKIVGRIAEFDVHRLCTELKITKTLDLCTEISEKFHLDLPKELSYLHIQYAKWVTLKKLLSIDSRMIVLGQNKLSVADLETFFTGWMQLRHHQNLKYFEIEVKESELLNAMLDNLGGQIIENDIAREFSFGSFSYTVTVGLDVKRKDDATGTIFKKERLAGTRICMIVH